MHKQKYGTQRVYTSNKIKQNMERTFKAFLFDLIPDSYVCGSLLDGHSEYPPSYMHHQWLDHGLFLVRPWTIFQTIHVGPCSIYSGLDLYIPQLHPEHAQFNYRRRVNSDELPRKGQNVAVQSFQLSWTRQYKRSGAVRFQVSSSLR